MGFAEYRSGCECGNGHDDDGNGFVVDDVYGYDFAGDADKAPDSDPMDLDVDPGHGSHVAGTVAAVRNNGAGVAGVNYFVRIMALKGSPDGDTIPDSASLAAIDYAVMMKTNGFNMVALNASYGSIASNSLDGTSMATPPPTLRRWSESFLVLSHAARYEPRMCKEQYLCLFLAPRRSP